MASSSNSRGLMLLLVTSGFFITGLLFDYMPMIVDNQIKRNVELATNDEIRAIWSKPPIDIDSYYWLYDVQNVDQFMVGEKPRVRKVGPFHFKSRPEKRIIETSQNKLRLIYNSTRRMKLAEGQEKQPAGSETGSAAAAPQGSSRLPLDEPLQLLNPIYAAMMEGTREFGSKMEPAMRPVVLASAARLCGKYNESLFMPLTPRAALLGRRVEFISKAKKMAENFGMGSGANRLPDMLNNNWFGYVAAQNGTWQGPFEIYSGYQASMPSLGDVISFQGKRRLTEFQGRCNRLQASAGELRPMPIGHNHILELYQPQFCRIVHLQPTGQRKLREGAAISYTLAPEDFLGAESNPDNRCFCVNGTVDNYCSLDGVIELAPCAYYAPIIVTTNSMRLDPRITSSLADWDPELMNSSVELLPQADNSSQMLILKRIGVPVFADITIVLFMKVIRDPRFKQTSSVPEVSYIPLLMARETARIPPNLGQIIINLESFLALTHHLKVVMYLCALVLLCWLTGHYYHQASKSDRVRPSEGGGGGSGDSGGGDNQTGSGYGARKGNAGAGSISNSERANSADSSRSQRPSRVSQSSMDAGDLSPPTETSGAGANGQPANKRDASLEVTVGSEPEVAAVAASNPLTAEEAPLPVAQTESQVATGETSAGPLAPAEDAGQAADGGMANEGSCQEELGERHIAPSGEQEAGPNEQLPKKSWLMKVSSIFVRMLNGIRTTISDAGQLDITEHDRQQDRQLELLAGKIDNWQRYNDSSNAPTDCSPSPVQEAADSNNNNNNNSNNNLAGEPVAQQQQSVALASEALGPIAQQQEVGGQLEAAQERRAEPTDEAAATQKPPAGVGAGGQTIAAAAKAEVEASDGLRNTGPENDSSSSNVLLPSSSSAETIGIAPTSGQASVKEEAKASAETDTELGSAAQLPVAAAQSNGSGGNSKETTEDDEGGGKNILRTESGQSNQTIINTGSHNGDGSGSITNETEGAARISDTTASCCDGSSAQSLQGDEEGEPEVDELAAASAEAQDKAQAFERMELALINGGGGGASSSDRPPEVGDLEESGMRTGASSNSGHKRIMINSSTSIDFGILLEADTSPIGAKVSAATDQVASGGSGMDGDERNCEVLAGTSNGNSNKSNESAAASSEGQMRNQSVEQNGPKLSQTEASSRKVDQVDESSLASGAGSCEMFPFQSNKLAPNGANADDERQKENKININDDSSNINRGVGNSKLNNNNNNNLNGSHNFVADNDDDFSRELRVQKQKELKLAPDQTKTIGHEQQVAAGSSSEQLVASGCAVVAGGFKDESRDSGLWTLEPAASSSNKKQQPPLSRVVASDGSSGAGSGSSSANSSLNDADISASVESGKSPVDSDQVAAPMGGRPKLRQPPATGSNGSAQMPATKTRITITTNGTKINNSNNNNNSSRQLQIRGGETINNVNSNSNRNGTKITLLNGSSNNVNVPASNKPMIF